jgi:hypothetical protein
MALAVPALTGYITKAQNKAAEAEGKTVLTAVQAHITEYGPATGTLDATQLTAVATDVSKLTGEAVAGSTTAANSTISKVTVTSGKVTAFEYTTSGGVKLTYPGTGGNYFDIS